MKKQLLLIASAMLLTPFFSVGQSQRCSTDEMMQKLYDADPAVRQQVEAFRAYAKKYTREEFINRSGKTPVYQIPIVFHVVHNYGGENISDATILNALDAMNRQWRKLNADTASIEPPFDIIHKDMEVEFVLAKRDPNGDCSTGITRTVSELTYSASDNVKSVTKNIMDWPSSQYLNIWIVGNIASGAGGYSYYPGSVGPDRDGIVVLAGQLSALAHEAGHWLALPHPWGDSNNSDQQSNCSLDDGIDDTPNTRGQSSCSNLLRNSCPGDPVPFTDINGNVIWPASSNDIHDNVQNVMDYAFCGPENFTEGQKAVTHASLNSSTADRNNLWTATNLTATGTNSGFTCEPTPIADFNVPYEYICTEFSMNLQNNTYNYNTVSYSWNFGDNSSATSTTEEEPYLYYTTPGIYDISLTATNGSGASSTVTKNGVAKILSGVPIAPVGEGFEAASFPENKGDDFSVNWFVDGEWTRTKDASKDGIASAMLDIKTVNGTHRMISPMMDFTQLQCDQLTFDLAYAARTANTVDKFRVKFSTTCGRTWPNSSTYEVTKQNIAPHDPMITGDYVPGDADWLTHTIDLSSFSGDDEVLVMFEVETSGGNRIYMDNVSFGCAKADATADQMAVDMTLFPNPTKGDANIRIFGQTGAASIVITDITGKQIATESLTLTGKTLNTSVSAIAGRELDKGVYLVSVQSGKAVKTTKLIIQ